jgi:hypothetical protein
MRAVVRATERGVTVVALAAAVTYTASALAAIVALSWRQPLFDQFIQLGRLLDAPLPYGFFVLDNGHAHLVPNLLRWLDLQITGGSQLLLIGFGVAALLGATVLLARVVLREREVAFADRCVAVLAIVLALYWLGNARTLLHGNESTHVYGTMLFTLVALALTIGAVRNDSGSAMFGATLAALAAMYTFASGVPAIGAVLLLAAALGMPLRRLVAPALAGGVAFVIYVRFLPGAEGIREALAFRPLDLVQTVARYLATPIVNGWLEVGAVGNIPPAVIAERTFGAMTLASGHWIAATVGVARAGTIIGLIGIAASLIALTTLRRHRGSATRMQALGIGIALFALGVAALVALARLDYFVQYPEQIHADRYSPWGALFWLGLVLALLGRPRHARALRYVTSALVLTAAALAWPMHASMPGWAAAVFQNAERAGAAYRNGVFEPAVMFPITNAPDAVHYTAIASFRREQVASFRQPWMRMLGEKLSSPPRAESKPGAVITLRESVRDGRSGAPALRIAGYVEAAAFDPDDAGLLLIDAGGIVRGSAAFSHGTQAWDWWPWQPRRDGFDGYTRAPDCAPLTLIAVDAEVTRTRALLELAPCETPQ